MYIILVVELEDKIPFGRRRRRRENNTKMDFIKDGRMWSGLI
jgi:hypothetical protein